MIKYFDAQNIPKISDKKKSTLRPIFKTNQTFEYKSLLLYSISIYMKIISANNKSDKLNYTHTFFTKCSKTM